MKSNPKILVAFVALISGIVLCNFFVYIAGYFAAIAIPREYFSFFGHDHIRAALFFLDILTLALPFFVIGLIWGILTSLALRPPFLSTSLWCGLGCLLAMIYFTFVDGPGAIYMAGLKEPYMFSQFLINTTAGPFGILVGGYFLTKFFRREKQFMT